jgi:hypothetical protein
VNPVRNKSALLRPFDEEMKLIYIMSVTKPGNF